MAQLNQVSMDFAKTQATLAGQATGIDLHFNIPKRDLLSNSLDLIGFMESNQLGVIAQLISVMMEDDWTKHTHQALKSIVSAGLTHDTHSSNTVKAIVDVDFALLEKYKSAPLTYRYLLKCVPLDSVVAMVANLSSQQVAQGIIFSSMQNADNSAGKWTQFCSEYGFDPVEYIKNAPLRVIDRMCQLQPGSTMTIGDACSLWPEGPFPAGYKASTSFVSSSSSTVTQGVSMTTATATTAISVNPAVKPLIDGMLAQAGVNLTIDSIVAQIAEKEMLQTTLVANEQRSEQTITELRQKLASAASLPSTMNVASSAPGTIPSGTMKMVQASTLFPVLAGVNLEIPLFTWDHAHPHVPETDSDYIFRKEMTIKALRCLAKGENLWLVGHTGTGKTTFIEQCAARMGWPVARVAFDTSVDRSELLGRMQLDSDGKGGTQSRWLPGILEMATANGYILLNDEMDAGHPNALYTLQPILEKKPLALLEDGGRMVPRGVMSRNVTTGNTAGNGDPSGLYPACRILSAATLDRFQTFVTVPYMTPDEETALIQRSIPGITKALTTKLVKFAVEMRQAFVSGETPISYSPRRSVAFAREVVDLKDMGFKDETAAITAAFKSKLYDAAGDEFKQRITEIANASFGSIDPTQNLV